MAGEADATALALFADTVRASCLSDPEPRASDRSPQQLRLRVGVRGRVEAAACPWPASPMTCRAAADHLLGDSVENRRLQEELLPWLEKFRAGADVVAVIAARPDRSEAADGARPSQIRSPPGVRRCPRDDTRRDDRQKGIRAMHISRPEGLGLWPARSARWHFCCHWPWCWPPAGHHRRYRHDSCHHWWSRNDGSGDGGGYHAPGGHGFARRSPDRGLGGGQGGLRGRQPQRDRRVQLPGRRPLPDDRAPQPAQRWRRPRRRTSNGPAPGSRAGTTRASSPT